MHLQRPTLTICSNGYAFSNDIVLFEYKVPPRYIWTICPDWPVDDNPTEPKYLEAAVQSLAKFNVKSEQTHYFSVLSVTRASMQVSQDSSDLF